MFGANAKTNVIGIIKLVVAAGTLALVATQGGDINEAWVAVIVAINGLASGAGFFASKDAK